MFMAMSIDFVVETNGTTTTRIVKPSDLRTALERDATLPSASSDEF